MGCGDVGMRVVKQLGRRWRVLVLTSSPARVAELRAAGVTPLLGNLDTKASLMRLAALAPFVLHLAPPPNHGNSDSRTRNLLGALARGGVVQRLIYASTTGVYGDAQGQWVDETRALAPLTARAKRRVDAESVVRRMGRVHGACASILRIPGIYALDREGGNPIDRVRQATPVLVADEDVYTNHIHADDLARACIAALFRGATQRVYHVSDDSHQLMGDYMDFVADLAALPRPPRITRAQAQSTLSPMTMSFLSESRRLSNQRLKRELRLKLHHPTPASGLAAAAQKLA